MSTTNPTPEPGNTDSYNYDAHSLVSRFREAYPNSAYDGNRLHGTDRAEHTIDGHAWADEKGHMVLLADDCTHYGYIEFADLVPADYVDTRTVEGRRDSWRCYAFSAGDHVHTVDVKIVRRLANEVFDLSYPKIRAAAYAHPDAESAGGPTADSPVLFDIPRVPFKAIVAPVIPPQD